MLTPCFNPRLRAGGDGAQRRARKVPKGFNPRLRAGGDRARGVGSMGCLSFNPRLRAGGDHDRRDDERHAPVSIHASAREATALPRAGRYAVIEFQSTPPRGRRRAAGGPRRPPGQVSIHASARGGDGSEKFTIEDTVVSIHASAREATAREILQRGRSLVSIHASAREATEWRHAFRWLEGFQSTPSAREATGRSRLRLQRQGVSIHASAREATTSIMRL